MESRINIDGPCKRCGLETFRRDCIDPHCHIATIETQLEQAREVIRQADEWFRVHRDRNYGSGVVIIFPREKDWDNNPAVIAAKEDQDGPRG